MKVMESEWMCQYMRMRTVHVWMCARYTCVTACAGTHQNECGKATNTSASPIRMYIGRYTSVCTSAHIHPDGARSPLDGLPTFILMLSLNLVGPVPQNKFGPHQNECWRHSRAFFKSEFHQKWIRSRQTEWVFAGFFPQGGESLWTGRVGEH